MPDQIPTAIADRTIGQYLATLGSSDPTPGGGSAAGVIGALGSSLGLMVIALTDLEASEAGGVLREAQQTLTALRDRFTNLARQDEEVYQGYRDAAALPKATPNEKAARREAMQSALKRAASVPLAMCEASVSLAETLAPVHEHGNTFLLSDARIGSLCARACFDASRVNVEVNLAMIKDAAWVAETTGQLDTLAQQLEQVSDR